MKYDFYMKLLRFKRLFDYVVGRRRALNFFLTLILFIEKRFKRPKRR